jgi:hypothetical protein
MAVVIRFESDEEKGRAIALILDRHFVVNAGLLISDSDLEILKQGGVKFEVEAGTMAA